MTQTANPCVIMGTLKMQEKLTMNTTVTDFWPNQSMNAYLYFIMFLYSGLLFIKVFTLCGAILRTVIIFLCRLFTV